jgi:hypothetical protein
MIMIWRLDKCWFGDGFDDGDSARTGRLLYNDGDGILWGDGRLVMVGGLKVMLRHRALL